MIVLACCSLAQAGVYRCDAGGTLQFSDKPCEAGQQPLEIARPNTLETSTGDRALAAQFDDHTAALQRSRKVIRKAKAEPAQTVKAREPRKDKQEKAQKSPKRVTSSKAPPPTKRKLSRP